jgi:hypothetical protein
LSRMKIFPPKKILKETEETRMNISPLILFFNKLRVT